MPLPKTIHYCWFGNGEKSELMIRCISSWKKYAPECEIIEWNERNYDVTKMPYMQEAFKAKRWGFVSDYARLDIIYEHGGLYFDTDVELIKPISELLEGTGFIGFEQANDRGEFCVNTGGGFGAEPHDPTVKELRDYYKELHFLLPNGEENLQPCPLYNTMAMKKQGLREDNSLQKIGQITVYPYEFFSPVNWKTHHIDQTANTFSIHHFDASWLSEKEKKRRKRARRIHEITHLPNRFLKWLLGEEKYNKVKRLGRKG